MNACASVGTMWPTFNVPGMFASSTTFFSLYIDVVVANDPTPSVSKKSVTAPIARCSQVGRILPVRCAWRYQNAQNAIPTPASKTNSAALALMALDSYPDHEPGSSFTSTGAGAIQIGGGGQMLSGPCVVMVPPAPVTQNGTHTMLMVSHDSPGLQLQTTCWLQLSK